MMRRLLIAVLAVGCADGSEFGELHRAPPIPNTVDDVIFEAGNWEPHLAAGSEGQSWGNHRAVVEIDAGANDPVFVTVPWRRHDPKPENKRIIVVNAVTQRVVANVLPLRVENESGDIVFQPEPGAETYHVYYMPWESTGGYYPQITHLEPVSTADATWLNAVRANTEASFRIGRVSRIQSVDAFHSFFPMEITATESESSAFLIGQDLGWAVVPEHRDFPVRMRWHLPQHWVSRGVRRDFSGRVLRNEYFTFQLAIVGGVDSLTDLRIQFDDFPDALLETLTCFNCEGIDERGRPFSVPISVLAGEVKPLWIGVQIPEDFPAGPVTGRVVITSANRGRKETAVTLQVDRARARNQGFDNPELMTRLTWLNSRVGADSDFIIAPFVPVSVEEKRLSVLGRQVELSDAGLPRRIASYFSPEMTHLVSDPSPILAQPIELMVIIAGEREKIDSDAFVVEQMSRGAARWSVEGRSERITTTVEGVIEYDGMLDYRIRISAHEDVVLDDVKLPVVLHADAANYMLGLGFRGGKRPTQVNWKWNVQNHQEGVWLGNVHKGLQYVLRDDGYVRPLNTNFYQNQPLRLPASWHNGGRGGIRITTADQRVVADNFSGPRALRAGESLQFNVKFLITPFKPIDTQTHFDTRFVHRYVPVDSVRAWGGTVVNIHHANEINPFINYPFFNLDRQTAYISEAHEKGVKVKLYNTIRELTYRAHELFALRSLGDEILNDGEGGGHSWMQEHLEDNYHSAWHAWRVDDAAMLNKGTSRWTNYYIEGLAWLAEQQHIDGLYLDDIAFSRETVKRMVSVLHQGRDEVVIDLHSANQFNPRDGYINSAMLYMEHFPYISRLWFGEYFEYDRDEDYWLTEVSGLPFGLMGEMLQDGGHPYRGLLYGMTARMYGDVDPRPIWKLMNEFGISGSRMLGYWLSDAPTSVNHPRILATTYVRDERILVVLASWSDQDEIVSVQVDTSLVRGGSGRALAPEVAGLQSAAEVQLGAVHIPANTGLYLHIER